MEREREELEELLPESSTQLVSLNTRVPRNVSRMIDESVGMLQTESPYLKISKQVAVQLLLERGFQAIKADFEREDPKPAENVVSIDQTPKSPKSFDVKAYAEMSNKTYFEPRKPQDSNGNSERTNFFREKLGLK